MCYTAIVYERKRKGTVLTFGVSGKLWKDSLIMFDRESRSLWSHVLGECISGDREGEKLIVFPSVQTTWREWKKAWPDTKVLLKDGGREEGSAYERYFTDDSMNGIFGRKNADSRLGGKDLVVGVRIGAGKAAFPAGALDDHPVVNTEVGGVPVVVAWIATEKTAFVYDRTFQGNVLRFEPSVDDGVLRMKDDRTGALWNVSRGESAGGRLREIPATQAFWFAWSSFFPQTDLWSAREK